MEIVVLKEIEGLAQNFLEAPRTLTKDSSLEIIYDYEMESGNYGEKSITFDGVEDYRHVDESNLVADMIKAYNSIAEVIDSSWLSNELISRGYKHYIIYFDEYGAYEVLAKTYRLE